MSLSEFDSNQRSPRYVHTQNSDRFELTQRPIAQKQHEHLNTMLNERAALAASSSFQSAPLKAKHTLTQDEFHPAPSSHSSGHHDSKLRVTRDDRTGQLVECIIKRRLGDLHILCPKREVDWRISVNIEEKVDISMVSGNSKALYSRKKDRMEYAHQWFRIDLTQVTDGNGSRVRPFYCPFFQMLISAELFSRLTNWSWNSYPRMK